MTAEGSELDSERFVFVRHPLTTEPTDRTSAVKSPDELADEQAAHVARFKKRLPDPDL